MIKSNEEEREVRIVLSKNPIANPSVTITPVKSNKVSSDHDDEEEVQESELDTYKDWLAYMHTRNQAMCELGHRYSVPWVWNKYSIPEPTSTRARAPTPGQFSLARPSFLRGATVHARTSPPWGRCCALPRGAVADL